MPDDEQQIRSLVEKWAVAVHRGDMDGVLADHAEDIVMFDVPPPHEGVRGIGAYRETWVSAGEDVAFAHALLRCDMPEGLARKPENRLRLTLGLRKERGRWTVAHEHHSFADDSETD